MNETSVFNEDYASTYDLVYADKDYAHEVEQILRLARLHGDLDIGRIADLGCGTGRHAVLLAATGLDVVGVDTSSAMLELARERAGKTQNDVAFDCADIRQWRAPEPFDVVIMMFAVLSYQVADADLSSALDTAAAALRPGGVFIADFWHRPAVDAVGLSVRERTIATPAGALLRRSSAVRLPDSAVIAVTIELQSPEARTLTNETHLVRAFDPDELSEALDRAGLRTKTFLSFPACEAYPTDQDWNALVVARR